MSHRACLAIIVMAVVGCHRTPATPATVPATAGARTTEWTRQLPSRYGADARARVLEVVYAPGQHSRPHSHPCDVIGHITEGSVHFKVNADPDTVYRAGDTFFEAANSRHVVSANASDAVPAKFVVVFLCAGEQPLTVPLDTTARDTRR